MRNMFVLAAFVSIVGFANAQEKVMKPGTTVKSEKFQNNFDRYSSELELTEDQKAKILAIDESYKEKRNALRSTGTAADFKKLNQQKEAEIVEVLTPEQKEKAKALKEKKNAEKLEKSSLKAFTK